MKPVEFINLGSGSRGNCTWLEYGDTCLLVDGGFSCKQLQKRIEAAGKDPERVSGILISHSHSDHICGVSRFCQLYKVPVYLNRLTQKDLCAIWQQGPQPKQIPEFKIFATGDTFEVGNIEVNTFQVPHDTSDPVGFSFQVGGVRLGHVTDLGKVTSLVRERLKGVYGLLFEANHDITLLRESSRTWALKQRIMSCSGHLSNEDSARFLEEIVSTGLKELVLGHLSQDCNRPEIALKQVNQAVGDKGVCIRVSSQESITRILPEGFSA